MIDRPDIGTTVTCATCGERKKPWGRDQSAADNSPMCGNHCPGYYQEPKPQDLWPGERRNGGAE